MTIQVIEDPKKVKILVEENRQKIICMLGRDSMSLSELARALNKTPATIFYHIKKLASVNLIKLEKTRVVNNNLVEKYYSLSVPSSCLVALRMFRPERGPVPPKKLSKVEWRDRKICPDVCWDDVFAALELKQDDDRKQQLINVMNKLFVRATFEADEAFKEVVKQVNIKLSSSELQRVEQIARVIPILTFCKMLKKPESLDVLKSLVQSISSSTALL